MKRWRDDDGMRQAGEVVCARRPVLALSTMKIGGSRQWGWTLPQRCNKIVSWPTEARCRPVQWRYEQLIARTVTQGFMGHDLRVQCSRSVLGFRIRVYSASWQTTAGAAN